MKFSPLALAIFFLPAASWPQSTAELQHIAKNRRGEYLSCAYSDPSSKRVWSRIGGGYEIFVGPTAHFSEGAEQSCKAAIYNRRGKVVFRTIGYSTRVEKTTALDFDGDREVDVVFVTDTGGGMHCCWEYEAVSLRPNPHVLFRYTPAGGTTIKKGKDGRAVLWASEGGYSDATDMADRPFATVVWEFADGRLTDVTPRYCGQILKRGSPEQRILAEGVTQDELTRFSSAENVRDAENNRAGGSVLSAALQDIFCQRIADANADMELWPPADRQRMKSAFHEWLLKAYPDAGKQLTDW